MAERAAARLRHPRVDKATLDRFIANPDEVVRGNAMKPYGGIASPDTRARIIAYLQASGGN